MKEDLSNLDSAFIWSIAFASLLYALFDHRGTCEEIRESSGWKKMAMRMKLFLLWAIPVTGIVGALAAKYASEKSDATIAELGTNVMKLTQANRDATNKITELERKLSHRVLTEEQKRRFLAFIKQHPKGRVTVQYVDGIPDRKFAEALQATFKEAGFEVDPWLGPFTRMGERIVGVKVWLKDRATEPAHSGALQVGLVSVGIDARGGDKRGASGWSGVGELDAETVAVVIGYKE